MGTPLTEPAVCLLAFKYSPLQYKKILNDHRLGIKLIEDLAFGRAAYFYKTKNSITRNSIDQLFISVRAQAASPSQNLFCSKRVELNGANYSSICFSFERKPSFLRPATEAMERVFGFLMLVERNGYVAILKSGLDVTPSFKTKHLGKISNERVEKAIAKHDSVFEHLRLKNMSSSRLVLSTKSMSGRNLQDSVPMASSSRFVPQGYRVSRPDGIYSATPSTGRISIRGERADYDALVSWSTAIIGHLSSDQNQVSSFIENFARPIEINAIPDGVEATHFSIDIAYLTEQLLEPTSPMRLTREVGGQYVQLTSAEVTDLLNQLDHSFSLQTGQKTISIWNVPNDNQIGNLKYLKTRISLQKFSHPAIANIAISACNVADQDNKPLVRYIDANNLFSVVFSDLSLAYIEGNLFKDQAMIGGGAGLLRHFRPVPDLANTTSEKGNFAADQTDFEVGSVFMSVVEHIANDLDVLVCDDLNDEWADFIGLGSDGEQKSINFFHAKHGNLSLGASQFHVAVSQAIKNLGRMALPEDAMQEKFRRWNTTYNNSNVETSISRIIRGGPIENIRQAVTDAVQSPELLKRAYIVTSSISYQAVEDTLNNAAAGNAPPVHFVQMFWLLNSYISACAEMGVVGYVVCQP